MSSSCRRVLVVDDYPDSAESACLLLRLLGHDALAAHTGEAALAAAALFDPQIVMLDIGLPDISGYEVARRLRERAAGKPLYLAAVTGWARAADRAQSRAAGFDLHVVKPTNADKIELILDSATRAFAASSP